jgi:hypothetical protein
MILRPTWKNGIKVWIHKLSRIREQLLARNYQWSPDHFFPLIYYSTNLFLNLVVNRRFTL